MSLKELFESYRERKSPVVARKILDSIRSADYPFLMAELLRDSQEYEGDMAEVARREVQKAEAEMRLRICAELVEQLMDVGRVPTKREFKVAA